MRAPVHATTAVECPACGEHASRAFFAMPGVPVHCNVFPATADEARSVPRGNVTLACCHACGYVHNVDFDASLLQYDADYENSLHFSPRFQAFAEATAGSLIERHDIRHGDVLEIGCGKGDFLALLQRLGPNRCVGFDASYDDNQEPVDGLRIEKSFFAASERPDVRVDLLASRHVLEHIEQPGPFLDSILPALRDDGVLYLEVPDGLFTLRDLGIWDVIYEHCAYYTPPALERVVRARGFTPLALESTFGGQFLAIEARRGAPGERPFLAEVEPAAVVDYAEAYAREFESKVAFWAETLADHLGRDARIAVWGAGSKGVTFLNVVPGGESVHAVVDINDRKQGRFVNGTAQRIVSPADAVRDGLDLVLVMNPNYADEIGTMLAELGSDAAILTV